ncbi:N-acetylneuraminate epimerase [Parasalinivibrio latis]|uniref:N-acetylneuraminate epimerase n=1 Tax=Parasalinivibrio latis TaxID=2952610 RepID=UPI0030E4D665
MKRKSAIKSVITASGVLGAMLAASSAMAAEQWPDLPAGVKNGIGVKAGNTLYVGLGSAGQSFYALDLKNRKSGWKKMADFNGPARSGATASLSDGKIFVFGGSGMETADAKSPVIFDSVYSFDIEENQWTKEKTKAPAGLLGATSHTLEDGEIVFFGGYNKQVFDKYLADVTSVDAKKEPEKWNDIVNSFMGRLPEGYRWNTEVLAFSPEDNTWHSKGKAPYLPNCGAAIVAEEDTVTLVSGEVKPGLRTDEVKTAKFDENTVWWRTDSALPKPTGHSLQEGVAGAYAGKIGDVLLVAGGANFHGARAQFDGGEPFAHKGLGKAYNPEIYLMENKTWKQANNLPKGIAYGASFTLEDGVLVVGGEDASGKALNDVYLLTLDGSKVSILN